MSRPGRCQRPMKKRASWWPATLGATIITGTRTSVSAVESEQARDQRRAERCTNHVPARPPTVISRPDEIELDVERHRDDAQRRHGGGEQHRADTLADGEQHRLDRLDAIVAVVVVVGVGQHDAVLHHDTGEGHDAQPGHDRREAAMPVISMPEQHARERHDDRRDGDEHLPEAVVLEQQDQRR